MAGIGIVSSVGFQNTAQQTAFQAGLNNQAVNYNIKDRLGFDRQPLAAAINALINDTNVTVIATVGGLVSCAEAILNNSSKPFISLIGLLPDLPFPQPISGMFKGCVTLDTIGQDAARIRWIQGSPWTITPATAIGLLYDPHTPMAAREIAAWTAAGGGQQVPSQNGIADPGNYSADFDNFGAGIEAVVISAAPRHHSYKEQLIAAANCSGFHICYPLQGYANKGGINQPIPGKSVTIGPELDALDASGAYFLLGQMASTVLAGGNLAQPIVTVPSPAPKLL
jgi:hypothetical protein